MPPPPPPPAPDTLQSAAPASSSDLPVAESCSCRECAGPGLEEGGGRGAWASWSAAHIALFVSVNKPSPSSSSSSSRYHYLAIHSWRGMRNAGKRIARKTLGDRERGERRKTSEDMMGDFAIPVFRLAVQQQQHEIEARQERCWQRCVD